MKRNFTKESIFLLTILFISMSWLQAQISIQSSEYNINFGTNHNFYFAEDSISGGFDVDVGTTGGSQTWDFTIEQFPGGWDENYKVMDPASTPYAEYLPQSNHVWYASFEEDTSSIYQFFNLTPSGLFLDALIITNGDSTVILPSEPSEKMLHLPAQMGESWTNNYIQSIGVEGFELVDSTSGVSTIDAWGTINIPAGSFECLRVREEETHILKIIFFGFPISADTMSTISYMWIGKEYGMLAYVTSNDNETDLNFNKAAEVTIRRSVSGTAIEEDFNVKVNTFELFQNYPNPFNPITTISYNLNKSTDVSLVVFNALGEKIETLVQEYQTPGVHQINWDASGQPSGIYFFNIQTSEGSARRKMILLK